MEPISLWKCVSTKKSLWAQLEGIQKILNQQYSSSLYQLKMKLRDELELVIEQLSVHWF